MPKRSEKLLAEVQTLISKLGDEQAFQLTSLEMEACAAEGDMPGMKQKADLLFAITTLITADTHPVYH
jgi:hypothetical protein